MLISNKIIERGTLKMYINSKKFIPKRFSSGELKLLHDDLVWGNFKEIDIIYNDNTISLLELYIIIKYYKERCFDVNLTLAYLPYQRMDHNNGYELETVKYIAQFFNELNLKSLKVCEPHCELNYFKNSSTISLVEPLFNILCDNLDDYVIFFTDKGSKKRYFNLKGKSVYAEKKRNKLTGLIESYEIMGDITGAKNVIIVDDIISTGDTILLAMENILKKSNCNIYIVCGHFEKNKYNKRLFCVKNLVKIYSSNSLIKSSFNSKLKLFDIKKLL